VTCGFVAERAEVDLVLEGAVTPMQQDSDGLWAPPHLFSHLKFTATASLSTAPDTRPQNTDVRDNLQSL